MKNNTKNIFAKLSRPVELTSGTPWRVIIRYAIPIVISYFLQQVYVLTDAIICGQVLTAEEVAGVNDTSPLTYFFLQFALGCTAGFSVITAKCAGNSDPKGVRRSFVMQIYLSAVISVVLTAISIPLLPRMLGIINVTPENAGVYNAAYVYCFVIFIGIAAQMGYNFICGVLRAYGDSVTPLIFLMISTALNIGLDVWFLVSFRMGPAGAAAATVLAQLVSVIFCFIYTLVRYPELRIHKEDLKVGAADIAAHLKQGIPLGLQFSILAIGIIVMQGAVVKFDLTPEGVMVAGTPAQNGFGAASKMTHFLMALYSGLGSAILGYNGQNYGKKEYERVRRGTLQTFVIMLFVYLFCLVAGLSLSIGGAYQYIFMSADKISDASVRFGNTFVYVDVILYFILGFLFVARSAVQGICRPMYVLGAGFAELAARVLICAYLPAIVNGAPIDSSASALAFAAVCLGDPGAWLAACIVLAYPTVRYIIRIKYNDPKDIGN